MTSHNQDHSQDEAKLRNEMDPSGDSLQEKQKMKQGVDIEPEADEWVAKPAAFTDTDKE
ncbi:hypothetical protein M3201_09035 [Paenibacillus motobuensis]|uniref:hypothetical protein n=1 Tax=Paenibacillus TaxID=44249 RepID=UPI001875C3A0|nr:MULTISPECIES: hypothetical protein [Paenibacillus]MCM3039838.1 hypothetical protein [Paenibacillus lutimineralis]MCM3646942.1 hypothetical protein [Paenibacillus motobuensis]